MNGYLTTVTDGVKLAYNLVHNLGRMWDDVDELIKICANINLSDQNFWIRVGYLLGDMINSIFYKPNDYDPYSK